MRHTKRKKQQVRCLRWVYSRRSDVGSFQHKVCVANRLRLVSDLRTTVFLPSPWLVCQILPVRLAWLDEVFELCAAQASHGFSSDENCSLGCCQSLLLLRSHGCFLFKMSFLSHHTGCSHFLETARVASTRRARGV